MCWRIEWKRRDSEDSTQSVDFENPQEERSRNEMSLESIKRLDGPREAQRGSPKSSQEQLVRDVHTCSSSYDRFTISQRHGNYHTH